MAGESADAVAASKLARARRLEDEARRYQQGAAGERLTATALGGLPPGWIVLHDLAWPGRPRANIDHVLVGPPGVVVVDSKNWTQRVHLEAGRLRQGGRDRSSTAWGAETAAAAIAADVGLPPGHVHAALCFTGQSNLDGFVGSVLVTSDSALVDSLCARPVILTPRQVWDHAERVRSRLGSASAPRPARPTAPTTSAPGRENRVRRRGRRPARRLRTLVVGVVALLVLISQPQLVQAASQTVGAFLSDLATGPAGDAEPPTADEPSVQDRRAERQPRRERERQERRERRAARQATELTTE